MQCHVLLVEGASVFSFRLQEPVMRWRRQREGLTRTSHGLDPHFPTSGPLLCIRTTSLYSKQRTSLHANHCNSSGTLPYIRTTFPCIRIISLHQDHFITCGPVHFPISGQFPNIQQPVSSLIICCTINNLFRLNWMPLHLTFNGGNY